MIQKSNSSPSKYLIDSICYWLGYQEKIGRERLLHEASLRYPIADTITAHKVPIKDVILEKVHPFFKNRRLDLVVYDGFDPNDKSYVKMKEIYEMKLAKPETGKEFKEEHQRVFNDVVRLAYLNHWAGKDCYFLMCGSIYDFQTYFIGHTRDKSNNLDGKNVVSTVSLKKGSIPLKPAAKNWHSNGLYSDWFEFLPGKVKKKTFQNDNAEWGLSKFNASYNLSDDTKEHSNQVTIKTTCIGCTTLEDINSRTHAAGLWKIEWVDQD